MSHVVIRSRAVLLIFVAAMVLVAPSLAQQPLPMSLQQAVSIALDKNPLRKAALADTKATSAEVKEARSFLLPHISFSETATRGNDPVYVFGSKLRQERFTNSDFALNLLNTPPPFGNFSTRFGGTWNLFDSFANWRGTRRASLMNQAAGHQLERTDQEIVFRVIDAYYWLLLANKELEVAEQSAKSAQVIFERSQNRFESGVAVQSDPLSAKVRLASRQQELIRARNNAALAQAQLATAIGVNVDSLFHPGEVLAERALTIPTLEELEKKALANRPDLKRIQSEEAAQRSSVSIAKSNFGPRVNAFAGWQTDNPTFLAGGGGNNWLGGIEVRFDLFEGGAKRAQLARERAFEQKISALRQSATDAILLDVRRAYYDVDASRQQLEVSRASVAEAQESLRTNQDRYDTGLITMADLLAAEDAARRSQADYWQTVYRFHTSYAAMELASGTLTSQSRVVTP
jgi:outer membrane protein TolC